MPWPANFAYKELDYPTTSERLPFAPKIDIVPLRCLLDPNLELDKFEEGYLELIRRVGLDASGIDLVPLSLDSNEKTEGIWHPNPSDPPGWHTFRRRTGAAIEVIGGNQHIESQIHQLAARDGLSYEQARANHLPLAGAVQMRDIHIYVMSGEPLYRPGQRSSLFICTPADAMAFIGLHQRLSGTIWTLQGGLPTGLSPRWTAHLLTRALMPELSDLLGRYNVLGFPRDAWSMLSSARFDSSEYWWTVTI